MCIISMLLQFWLDNEYLVAQGQKCNLAKVNNTGAACMQMMCNMPNTQAILYKQYHHRRLKIVSFPHRND